MVSDKDIEGMLKLLPQNATYYFAKANIPRAMDAIELTKLAAQLGLKGQPYPSVQEGLVAAKHAALANDLIFIGGSTFVVAEVV